MPHATAYDYDDVLKLVAEEAAKLLVGEHGLAMEDGFILLGVACDDGVAQACKLAEGFRPIARFSIAVIRFGSGVRAAQMYERARHG